MVAHAGIPDHVVAVSEFGAASTPKRYDAKRPPLDPRRCYLSDALLVRQAQPAKFFRGIAPTESSSLVEPRHVLDIYITI
jgi:hypothetical protein